MILEGSYCAFRSVAPMHVRGNELEFGTPCEGDCLFKCGTGFVVHDLEIDQQPLCGKMCHDGVICCKAMGITLGFEGPGNYLIRFLLICFNHF